MKDGLDAVRSKVETLTQKVFPELILSIYILQYFQWKVILGNFCTWVFFSC